MILCRMRHCEEPAAILATEEKGYEHYYCLNHLWHVEETDTVELVNAYNTLLARPSSPPPKVSTPPPTINIDNFDVLPVTIAQPDFNDEGFGVGFVLVHPPGVECVFPPSTKQCSCGRMDLGVVSEDEQP